MDVDARRSEDHFGPVMIQEHALDDSGATPTPDAWSGWAKLVDLPADHTAVEDRGEVEDHDEASAPAEARVDAPLEAAHQQSPPPNDDLVSAVARLAAELADERRLRATAERGRREAEARLHTAEAEAKQLEAEVAADRTRIAELERDRDDVIRRAEELLTAVRERADQRLATELDATSRHWTELLTEERRRVEALDIERAALARRVEDAWLASAVLRRARPLRLRDDEPNTPAEAEEEVLEALDEYEIDPAFAAESPEIADEIEQLRQRLRAQVRKPAEIDEVEDGVDQLREARLARDAAGKGRRRK